MRIKRSAVYVLLAVGLLALAATAFAQAWPARSVIVPQAST